jgi:peptide-methionine (R)-S-oxide reductase
LPIEEQTMWRNRILTTLIAGGAILFLEIVAAAPPAATETKADQGPTPDAAKGAKSNGKAAAADKKLTPDEDSPREKEKVVKTDAEWRKILTPLQFKVTRKKFTEQAGTGAYAHSKRDGVYHCVCCGEALFDSKAKFDSGTGWPSFFRTLDDDAITELEDTTDGSLRTEVQCSRCAAHLGHVFSDGPPPTGLRFCMNSASLKFVDRKKEQAAAKNAKTPHSKPAKKTGHDGTTPKSKGTE